MTAASGDPAAVPGGAVPPVAVEAAVVAAATRRKGPLPKGADPSAPLLIGPLCPVERLPNIA